MECFKYAFYILTVSDGMCTSNPGGLQADLKGGSAGAEPPQKKNSKYSPNMTTRTCEQEQSTLFGRGAQIYIKLYSPCWPPYASTRTLKGTLAGQLVPHKSKKSRFWTLVGL